MDLAPGGRDPAADIFEFKAGIVAQLLFLVDTAFNQF